MKRKILCTITLRCNNRCLNCFIPENVRDSGKELSLEDLKRLFSEIRIENDDTIEITGGEPTTHRNIVPILTHIRDTYPAKVVLITNAQQCAGVAHLVDEVVTNVYDHNESVHDYLSGISGSFNKKVEGLKNLGKYGVRIKFKVIPMLLKYRRLPMLVEFIRDNFNSPHLIIKTLDIVGSARTNNRELSVRLSEVAPYLESALDKAIGGSLTVNTFFPLCLINKHFWKYAPFDYDQMVKNTVFLSPNRGLKIGSGLPQSRPQKCEGCVMVARCVWFWRSYIPILGDDELRPITAYKNSLHREVFTPFFLPNKYYPGKSRVTV